MTKNGAPEETQWDAAWGATSGGEPADETPTPRPEASPTPPAMPEPFIAADAGADPEAMTDCNAYAKSVLHEHGADTVNGSFTVANVLHSNRCVKEAAFFYRRAYDLHDKNPGHYPLAQSLLQVRLLCLLKAGEAAPPEEMAELEALSLPCANYIRGVSTSWRDGNPLGGLTLIGNAFEEFHTGEEIDCLYLEIARQTPGFTPFASSTDGPARIPPTVYFYWDKNPPEEIRSNFDRHRQIDGLTIKVFDQEEAAEWLYSYYGHEARQFFLTMRHPAEAADFLRVHVINLLGGWWLDADIALKNDAAINFISSRTSDVTLLLTTGNIIHNDFFGSVANTDILSDCLLSLYRNCHLHKGLFISLKTGPGIFNRALSRYIHKQKNGVAARSSVELHGQATFDQFIEEFDTPYKAVLPRWQIA